MIRIIAISAFAALCITHPAAAQSPGSLLIWPVNPVIPAEKRAAALWLENPGKTPITLQVQVFAWSQQEAKNVYAPQNNIVGTPPIVTIEPGQRQLVRLTRTMPTLNPEEAYRVVVDEIPVRVASSSVSSGAAVSFRMRYSIPLFGYREKGDPQLRQRAASAPDSSGLHWRADHEGRFLEVRNDGRFHAKLVDVAFKDAAGMSPVANGLLGYVLPGASMRWPLPDTATIKDTLFATVNGAPPRPISSVTK